MKHSLASLFALVVMSPGLLVAQQGERSARWGIASSFTPHWTAAPEVRDYVRAEAYDIAGREFTIGVVRGRDYSGDWGVSFAWKSVSDGSLSRFSTRDVCVSTNCVRESATIVTKGVSLFGVEAHRFFPLVPLGRRAHLGVNLAGGILHVTGRTVKTERYAEFEVNPATGAVVGVQNARVSDVGGGQIFTIAKDVHYVPSAKLELGVGVALTRNVKTRISAGLDFPGLTVFSMSVVYLLGRPGPESIFR